MRGKEAGRFCEVPGVSTVVAHGSRSANKSSLHGVYANQPVGTA